MDTGTQTDIIVRALLHRLVDLQGPHRSAELLEQLAADLNAATPKH